MGIQYKLLRLSLPQETYRDPNGSLLGNLWLETLIRKVFSDMLIITKVSF